MRFRPPAVCEGLKPLSSIFLARTNKCILLNNANIINFRESLQIIAVPAARATREVPPAAAAQLKGPLTQRCCSYRCCSTSCSRRGLATQASCSLPEVTPAIVGSQLVRDPYDQLAAAHPAADSSSSGSSSDSSSSGSSSDSSSSSSSVCGGPDRYVFVRDPSTGEVIGRTPNLGVAWVRAAVSAAATAQPGWGGSSVLLRSNLLLQWHRLIEERKESLAQLITLESGKPIPESRQEVLYAASYIRWSAEEARRLNGLVIPAADSSSSSSSSSGRSKLQYTLKEPLGVCALITPFNFPLAMAARKASAALAAGNSCVLRPSEETPLSSLALAAAAREAGLPPGLLNVVPSCRAGAAAFAAAVAAEDAVAVLSFTGSTAVGRHLYRQCASTTKRLLLELGGNAPFVVFADADLQEAVLGLLAAKLRCSGQACVSANRVYVHGSVFDEFARQATRLFKQQKVGCGRQLGVSVGPLINPAAVERAQSLVADACNKGAKLLLGNNSSSSNTSGGSSSNPSKSGNSGGYFFPVTVLDCRGISADARVCAEELFSPIVCLYDFEEEEEVMHLCNSTEAGLASYFFTRDLSRALRVAQRMQAGMVGINSGIISSCEIPFGGCKSSGFGREGSVLCLDDYTNTKVVIVKY
ncbi:succinate-semialdehyde dehydrogenase, putative [Eimeria maxima]|uniref:Succinate-semialdehyde dehydrogenase, putative n=1 Tax=Eimeria maxima TaxID=5804 RepID=U6M079_EIMMA|nr:succinate-semialdehyde dehydrogenase, putative [Eimeria maxima]CDJ56508.1 succinate-semialdehyde dehydrogenase, putative [Eimeria maxima]